MSLLKYTKIKMERQVQHIAELLAEILPEDVPSHLEPIHRRRLEIVIRTHMGQSQAEICSALGCSKDTARHWMTIAKNDGLTGWYEQPMGRPKKVDERYLKRLRELVTSDPKDYGYSFSRWTAKWLGKHLAQELGIEISDRHVNRLLKQMGLSTRDRAQSKNTEKSLIKGQTIVIDDLSSSLKRELEKSDLALYVGTANL